MTLKALIESLTDEHIAAITKERLTRNDSEWSRMRIDVLEKLTELDSGILDLVVAIPSKKGYSDIVQKHNKGDTLHTIKQAIAEKVYTIVSVSDVVNPMREDCLSDGGASGLVHSFITEYNVRDVIAFFDNYMIQHYGIDFLSRNQTEKVLAYLNIRRPMPLVKFLDKLFDHDIVKAQIIMVSLKKLVLMTLFDMYNKKGRLGAILHLDDYLPDNPDMLRSIQALSFRPIRFVLTSKSKNGIMYKGLLSWR